MAIFAIWFEKHLCKVLKGYGSSVGKLWFCKMLSSSLA
jgi:hypothetical protein